MTGYDLDRVPSETAVIDLPNGVSVTVIPCDTVVYEAARAKMHRLLADFQQQQADAASVGVPVAGIPDLTDEDLRTGFAQYLFVVALAQAGITGWSGPTRGKTPIDLSSLTPPERDAAIARLMRDPAMADSFAVAYTRAYRELAAEGNASAPAPHGSTAAGATTANAAATNPPAPATAPAEAAAQ